MGKRHSKRQGSPAKSSACRCEAADLGLLPEIVELRDTPTFDDVSCTNAQLDAFDEYREESDEPQEVRLGCIVRLDRGFPLVVTSAEVFRAEHSVAFAKGKRREGDLLPAIGDWVAVRRAPGHDMGVILRVLPRRCAFERWRGKKRGERQVLAANIDTVLIVQALGAERDTLELVRDRIARSMVLACDCGADPVVVLTKSDRCGKDELASVVSELAKLTGPDVRIIATSSFENSGIDEVRSCVPQGTFAMILGESGAGKSTLINRLLGHEAMATNEVRERDDAGRHTTVARVMLALPGACGVVADAPGLRSLPLVGHERGLALSFPEVVEASRSCRFNDCTHTHEPGCAVREGVEAGTIESVRAEAFLSLAREMRVSAQSLDPDLSLIHI